MLPQKELDVPMHFLDKSDLWDTVKPYTLQYYPKEDFPRDNLLHSPYTVQVKSMREIHPTSLDNQGFEVHRLVSQMQYEDFTDEAKIEETYCKELEKHFVEALGAKHVRALDYQIRRKLPGFPYFGGKLPPTPQPSLLTHVDVTPDAAATIVRELYGDTAETIMKNRYEIITVWKPCRTPVQDWPLAVCDANSVDEDDLVPTDVIYPKWVAENCMVRFNAKQKWYWLPDQQDDELLVFKAYDSGQRTSWPCPHGAFRLPDSAETALPRESIDVRLLVMYADTNYPAREPWSSP
ncbi:hypothetical protein BDV96DRAFT_641935 [Lophiotrema nucula]|uniref:Uncharacterized protein n=1 Tax=Lophiotrema nucula TaxID=690887 RepID=A0A6A5ZML5_9PLEO|nr:hypothetical protein BDV96DRAFT_641935 [Lophiotrema nucula]